MLQVLFSLSFSATVINTAGLTVKNIKKNEEISLEPPAGYRAFVFSNSSLTGFSKIVMKTTPEIVVDTKMQKVYNAFTFENIKVTFSSSVWNDIQLYVWMIPNTLCNQGFYGCREGNSTVSITTADSQVCFLPINRLNQTTITSEGTIKAFDSKDNKEITIDTPFTQENAYFQMSQKSKLAIESKEKFRPFCDSYYFTELNSENSPIDGNFEFLHECPGYVRSIDGLSGKASNTTAFAILICLIIIAVFFITTKIYDSTSCCQSKKEFRS